MRTRRFPIEELFEAMHCHDRRLPLIVLLGGITGMRQPDSACSTGCRRSPIPINVGGKPFNSWPSSFR